MKNFQEDFIKIAQTERGLLAVMIVNLLLSIALLVFSIIILNPDSAVVKVGYGDIGGYRDGSWVDLLAFPVLAVIFGIFHNLLALRVFRRRGSGMAKLLLILTTFLIIGAFLVFSRLLGES